MKATLRVTIDKMDRDSGFVRLAVLGKGKVDTLNINAQDCGINGSLNLKELVANKLSIGTVLTVTVTDEKAEE